MYFVTLGSVHKWSLKFSLCLPMIAIPSMESHKNTYSKKQDNWFYLCQPLDKVILKLLLLFAYRQVCCKNNENS